MRKREEKGAGQQAREGGGLGGILIGFADLLGRLGDLAETGERLSKSGEIRLDGQEKGIKGVYGFSVKVGLGGKGVEVEPFGNIHKDRTTGRAMVEEVREPLVDVFEEEDHATIVAEMPGVGAEDVHLDLRDDVLTISAEKGEKKYQKEVLLPHSYPREKMRLTCNNGIVEIKCFR